MGTQMMSGEWEQEPQTPNKCSILEKRGHERGLSFCSRRHKGPLRSSLNLVSVRDCWCWVAGLSSAPFLLLLSSPSNFLQNDSTGLKSRWGQNRGCKGSQLSKSTRAHVACRPQCRVFSTLSALVPSHVWGNGNIKKFNNSPQWVTDCVSYANDFTVRWSVPECVYTALDSQTLEV